MKYFLFAGAANTGKTESIYRLTKKLIENKKYEILKGEFPDTIKDFSCILIKRDFRILIHSYTDLPGCIKELKEFYQNNSHINLIITATRDKSDYMRNRLFNELDISLDNIFEIPLGKVKRGMSRQLCIDWYLDSIEILALKIVEMSPFNL